MLEPMRTSRKQSTTYFTAFSLKPHPGLAFKNSYSTELAQFAKISQFKEAVVELLQWNVMSESHVSIFCRFTNQRLGPSRIVIGKLRYVNSTL